MQGSPLRWQRSQVSPGFDAMHLVLVVRHLSQHLFFLMAFTSSVRSSGSLDASGGSSSRSVPAASPTSLASSPMPLGSSTVGGSALRGSLELCDLLELCAESLRAHRWGMSVSDGWHISIYVPLQVLESLDSSPSGKYVIEAVCGAHAAPSVFLCSAESNSCGRTRLSTRATCVSFPNIQRSPRRPQRLHFGPSPGMHLTLEVRHPKQLVGWCGIENDSAKSHGATPPAPDRPTLCEAPRPCPLTLAGARSGGALWLMVFHSCRAGRSCPFVI